MVAPLPIQTSSPIVTGRTADSGDVAPARRARIERMAVVIGNRYPPANKQCRPMRTDLATLMLQ